MKETKYAGTQTEKNLMAAFAGESEARNKYTYFASKAKKEGYEQIAALPHLDLALGKDLRHLNIVRRQHSPKRASSSTAVSAGTLMRR
jgi:rubrerythrin